jgi:hypothetical protein
MSALEERPDPGDEAGYGAAVEGETTDASDQEQPESGEPGSGEEADQDNYVNTEDEES